MTAYPAPDRDPDRFHGGSDPRGFTGPAAGASPGAPYPAGPSEYPLGTSAAPNPPPVPEAVRAAPGPSRQSIRDADRQRRQRVIDEFRRAQRVLTPRPVSPDRIVPRDRFAEPPGFAEAVKPLRPDGHRQVAVLVGTPGTGRRTAALRLLDIVRLDRHPILELLPDWDRPDPELIPCDEDGAGYLLVLDGPADPWEAGLAEALRAYEHRAARRQDGPVLVVVTEHPPPAPYPASDADVPVIALRAPAAADVARSQLEGDLQYNLRASWLEAGSGSVFSGLLAPDASPADGARLAEAVRGAADDRDRVAVDRFGHWSAQIDEWFPSARPTDRESYPELVAHRTLLIAAAFLDRCPAEAVITARNELLADARVGRHLMDELLELDVRAYLPELGHPKHLDAPVTLEDGRPGIRRAVLAEACDQFRNHHQVILDWLPRTVAPGGAGEGHVARLTESLAEVLDVAGPDRVLRAVITWLESPDDNHRRLAAEMFDTLARHERFGVRVRQAARRWSGPDATGAQRYALAQLCAGRTGDAFPVFAMDRLRELLTLPQSGDAARGAALSALVRLGRRPEHTLRVLAEVESWGLASSPTAQSAFLALADIRPDPVAGNGPTDGGSPSALLRTLLAAEAKPEVGAPAEDGPMGPRPSPAGATAVALLTECWRTLWQDPAARPEAAAALDALCGAAEQGLLPEDAVSEVVSGTIADPAVLDTDLFRVIGIGSRFRMDLLRRYVEAVREAGQVEARPETTWSGRGPDAW